MRYVLRRTGLYIVAAWVATTLNFVIPRLITADPASILFAFFRGRMQPDALRALRTALGFTQEPWLTQYARYMTHVFQGDFGISIAFFPLPVCDVIWPGLLWTVMLAGVAVVISFSLGGGLGLISVWKPGGLVDSVLRPILALTGSCPSFFLAMIALLAVSRLPDLAPLRHARTDTLTPAFTGQLIMDLPWRLALPATCVIIASAGGWLLTMRRAMIATLAEDYVTLADAKGLPPRRVMLSYVARNALLPNITALGLALGLVLGGQLLTEIVFAYPGLGYLLWQAVHHRDYPLLQALVLVVTLASLAANLLIDLLYVRLDPRTRGLGSESLTTVPQPLEHGARLVTSRNGEAGGLRRFMRDPTAMIGLAILTGFVALAALAPVIAPGDPMRFVATTHREPAAEHLLGTSGQGQDVFAQVAWGARTTLLVAFVAGAASTLIGAGMGLAAGCSGRAVGAGLSTLISLCLIIPGLPLMAMITAFGPPGPATMISVLALTGWAWPAQVMRWQALSLRRKDSVPLAVVDGERKAGLSSAETLSKVALLAASSLVGSTQYALGASVALEFLGVGAIGHLSWGGLLFQAQHNVALPAGAGWTFIPAGVCVALVAFALALIYGAIDQITSPRLRAAAEVPHALQKLFTENQRATPVVRSANRQSTAGGA